VDHDVQRQRLTKESDKLQRLVINIDRQLANEEFLNGAPPHVVESLRAKRSEYMAQIEKNRAALAQLQ
jgi:valyl-tRNA synthetase